MEVDTPREGARRQRAVLRVQSRPAVADHHAAAVERAGCGCRDRRCRGLVRTDREHGLGTRRAAEIVRDDGAEPGAGVGLRDRGDGVVLRRRAGDVSAVPLPLIAKRCRSRRAHAECHRGAGRDSTARGLRRDRGRGRAIGDAVHDTRGPAGHAGEVIEAAIIGHLQVDRGRDPCREGRDCVAVGGLEPADPPGAVVGEKVVVEVIGGELRGHRRVERAAHDRAGPGRMSVAVSWRIEARIRGRSFGVGPSVVRSGPALVDLFLRALADVVDEHRRAGRIEGERERVAQTDRPDRAIDAGRRAEERIVGGDAAVGIHAQNLAEPVAERLRVRCDRVLADRDVQLVVRTEAQGPGVVIRSAEVLQLQQHSLAAGHGSIAARGEPADPIVYGRRRRRVIDVDELVDREIRIERHAEQSALSC